MTSREAMLFMKYEHYGKCKDSFKDTQRKCKYLIILLKHYFFFKKTYLITQSKLLISVYLSICINDIAICTKESLFTDLVGMETFGTSIWRIILFILLKII